MNYILLDESGDLGFKFNRGSSRYFIVTILFTSSKRPLEKVTRNVHQGLRKKFKRVGTLHAYKETPVTRTRILQGLSTKDCAIVAVILNKQRVYTNLQEEKSLLYNYVTNILLDRLFTKRPIPPEQPITLIASRRETNKFLNANFKAYLKNKISTNRHLRLTIEISTPNKEKSLQAVDFVSWAIFRKHELGDMTYYNLIKTKLIDEAPLFPETQSPAA